MKIARFSTGDEPRYGIVQGLDEADAVPTGESEGHLLVLKGDPLFSVPEATGEVIDLGEARLLAPVIPRSKVVAIGKNYAAHAAEMVGGMDGAVPRTPIIFLKPNTAVIGPDAPIVLPTWSEEVHYEAELAVVIKRIAKDLAPQDAHRVIMGYAVANDVSARDRQRAEPQWARAKAFDTSCPLGPWIEIPEPGDDRAFDPSHATVRTRLDGETVQEGNTRDMVMGIAELVAYASTIFTLLPGDVILTGTPAGVGEIRAGQRVSVEVEGIGGFSNPVVRR
ncbi:fumarylacetoacetate hydrolase family protein [Actinomyces sp. Chiba101]|uniref:2-keto-4-pentenoate hydratase/2-oxohepta-3-ene-1,7-dioic acid hydratase (Catechol pathway) n=1 Tax=Actinomyces denticolens TaxID=52767 RepID=A0ABY1IA34_9ACTO|nr:MULTISPECIES: fumarylacetoacetate hydrolase family protein [Actinomyces]BAW93468.1 fumarylacetoacetate hydrolase family protein [Actinomyces sp. Chiba101]GAV93689.1 fumarylacetoacetate hydrolase family protein [Actinomyces denticolens]SHI73371.1 2-keto-4-pentenoate hydratase/2-oxohepta-3-ene-1,7-dioic acid hydratase (catechol pathway) [Actinomyces denticolens]SUU02937.1 2-keto-4-pentenoate hydratase/2-oxohepta-3-ene-1,7-dioic acid hydratase (catechol pathway) [Actinomyces denticolens]